MVVGVGLVELQHGELGVVLGADAFVAEVAVDLIDAVEAADHQPLEVQLRRDAQRERDVQRVVVRGERARGSAAGDGVQHRRLDFEVAARVKKLAHGAQDGRALDEGLAHLGVGEEVHVALAVADLYVLQATPLVGQREHRFGQEGDARDFQRELAGACAHERAAHADVVAEVEQLVEFEEVVADVVLADIDL